MVNGINRKKVKHYQVQHIIRKFLLLQEDLKYEYTTCDDNGGRWKVEVPIEPGKCSITSPKAPVRGKSCGKLSVARSARTLFGGGSKKDKGA